MPDFKNTDRVHHDHYGYGDVIDVQGVEVTVLFDKDTEGVAERRMLSSMGRLRLVPIGEEEPVPEAPKPVEPPKAQVDPPKPPVEEAPTHLLAKGDEVAIAFKAGDEPIGRVAILRNHGGYRVNLYRGGTMCFGPQELKLLRRNADIPAVAESMQQIVDPEPIKDPTKPEPPPEPDPLIKRMDEEITRRGRGAMLAVTQAVGVTISMIYHWRRTQRISFPEQRTKIQAWIDAPWEPEPSGRDQLFLDMEATIAARGFGAQASLTHALGIHKTAVKNWRLVDKIPPDQRAGVQAWINKDPEVFKFRPKLNKETPVDKDPPPDLPKNQITQDTIKRLLREMGMRYTACWVIENGDLVKKEAWIMGNAP